MDSTGLSRIFTDCNSARQKPSYYKNLMGKRVTMPNQIDPSLGTPVLHMFEPEVPFDFKTSPVVFLDHALSNALLGFRQLG